MTTAMEFDVVRVRCDRADTCEGARKYCFHAKEHAIDIDNDPCGESTCYHLGQVARCVPTTTRRDAYRAALVRLVEQMARDCHMPLWRAVVDCLGVVSRMGGKSMERAIRRGE